ncbi:MAG: hypothetical protein MMC33_001030 [Icmadophila ericetorum]|nr:hypothetical protein [Icmadophila ericetorum]
MSQEDSRRGETTSEPLLRAKGQTSKVLSSKGSHQGHSSRNSGFNPTTKLEILECSRESCWWRCAVHGDAVLSTNEIVAGHELTGAHIMPKFRFLFFQQYTTRLPFSQAFFASEFNGIGICRTRHDTLTATEQRQLAPQSVPLLGGKALFVLQERLLDIYKIDRVNPLPDWMIRAALVEIDDRVKLDAHYHLYELFEGPNSANRSDMTWKSKADKVVDKTVSPLAMVLRTIWVYESRLPAHLSPWEQSDSSYVGQFRSLMDANLTCAFLLEAIYSKFYNQTESYLYFSRLEKEPVQIQCCGYESVNEPVSEFVSESVKKSPIAPFDGAASAYGSEYGKPIQDTLGEEQSSVYSSKEAFSGEEECAYTCYALERYLADVTNGSDYEEFTEGTYIKATSPIPVDYRPTVSSAFRSPHNDLSSTTEDPFSVFEDDPLDKADAEELSEFAATKEICTRPSGLQIPFDDNERTNESYDTQLQYSPVGSDSGAISTEDLPRKSSYSLPSASPYISPHTMTSSNDGPLEANSAQTDEEDFFADEDETDLMTLVALSDVPQVTNSSPDGNRPSTPKLQWNQPTFYKPSQSSPTPNPQMTSPDVKQPLSTQMALSLVNLIEVSQSPLQNTMQFPSAFIANVSPPSGGFSLPAPIPVPSVPSHCIAFDTNGNPFPFARPAFPKPVGDRCPIIGLSSSPILRTCFRIGEAFNATGAAVRSNLECIIELYVQVKFSEREADGRRLQYFQFGDLFQKDKSPYLSGTYDMSKGANLWDCDSKIFLGEGGKGRIARVIGKMKRDERSGSWTMIILSIWEADMEAVSHVKGIVFAQGKVETGASENRYWSRTMAVQLIRRIT